MNFDYKIIRTKRKTVALQIKNGEVVVRAPKRMKDGEISLFVQKHIDWIEKHLAKQAEELSAVEPFSKEEIHALAENALKVIPPRVEYYAKKIGVTYGRITIRNQKTRWGSCSSKGNLNFNCLLMLAPIEVIDSVIVHELCHRKEMNHSERFYDLVLKAFPDYHLHNKWLKDNGGSLMRRIP